MLNTTNTIQKLLDIQHNQLLEWKSILKDEVYSEVENWVNAVTPVYTNTETIAVERDYDSIPRGTYIYEQVHRLMIGCKFAPELKKQLRNQVN